MGWKIVRDLNEKWCRANGVSGQWRVSPDPVSALVRKVGEEYLEYIQHFDPAELFDLRDVLHTLHALTDPAGSPGREFAESAACAWEIGEEYLAYIEDRNVSRLRDLLGMTESLIQLADPNGTFGRAHAEKVAEMGLFKRLVEWTPVPSPPAPSPDREDSW
jgi:predicted house-cleaning noncanonical NTP pyrophosphatase (MazG superfamily)